MAAMKPHVSLNVSDVEKSVTFYEKVFGVPASKRRPGYAKFDLAVPSLNLTMQEAPPTGINASHFGVQCETADDVYASTLIGLLGAQLFAESANFCGDFKRLENIHAASRCPCLSS